MGLRANVPSCAVMVSTLFCFQQHDANSKLNLQLSCPIGAPNWQDEFAHAPLLPANLNLHFLIVHCCCYLAEFCPQSQKPGVLGRAR